ncbi:MAG: hypothetical protein H6713_01965 [Myxococcales bacterium]|nr:hypothetical protein [Myxococcales bacterium]
MDETTLAKIYDRVAAGGVTAVLGCEPGRVAVAPKPGLEVIRVECDALGGTLGLLPRARQQLEAYLEAYLGGDELDAPLLQQLEHARGRVVSGIRRRLLGDAADTRADAQFVAACTRLAELTGGRAALVFDGIDVADRGSLARLGVLLAETAPAGGAFVLPLVLCFRARAPEGVPGELLAVVRRVGGDAAVIEAPERMAEAAALLDADTPRAWPAEVSWILRCVAVIGPAIELEFLGRLLELDELAILRLLQRGVELGCQLVDDGCGRVVMDRRTAEMLRATTLPSLRAAWHRRAAALLSDQPRRRSPLVDESAPNEPEPEERSRAAEVVAEVVAAPEPSPEPRADAGASPGGEAGVPEAGSTTGAAAVSQQEPKDSSDETAPREEPAPDRPAPRPSALRFAEMFVPGAAAWTEPTPADEVAEEGDEAATTGPGARRRHGPRRHRRPRPARRADAARAARHLAAAGEAGRGGLALPRRRPRGGGARRLRARGRARARGLQRRAGDAPRSRGVSSSCTCTPSSRACSGARRARTRRSPSRARSRPSSARARSCVTTTRSSRASSSR